MKVLKMFFSIVSLFLGNIGIAQSPAIVQYATSTVERLNDRITSINPNVPLTPDQVKIITDLQIGNFIKTQEIKKANGTQKGITKQNQKIGTELTKNILTKEQRKARKKWGDQYRAGKIVATPNKAQKPAGATSLTDKEIAPTPKTAPSPKMSDYPPHVVKNGIKQADKFNEILKNGGPNMILSTQQYEMVKAKAMELAIQVGAIKKSGNSDEQAQIKALRAAYSQDIKTTVLSKTQLNAFNKGWKSMQATKK